MAKIKSKGDFDYLAPHLPTYRKTGGILDGKSVVIDWNKIEVNYNGNIGVWVQDQFIKYTRLVPIKGEEDYFDFMRRELRKISATRRKEVRAQKKLRKVA